MTSVPSAANNLVGFLSTKAYKMASSDKCKQSLYFPRDMLEEIVQESRRQDRSMSWIVQRAWMIARDEIRKYPSINDFSSDERFPDDK